MQSTSSHARRAADIAAELSRKRIKARDGNYLVPCPCHHDREPSLSIRDGERGLLVHCFAGCDARDVLDELRRRGLLDDGPIRLSSARNPPTIDAEEERDYARKLELAERIW